jgi:dihydrolipoamide dehydrogenase
MATADRTFDLAVVGAGPGGYVAAIRAAQLGMRVAIVERDKLGGVCLNTGCIPTKALLQHAELLHTLKRAEEFGFSFDNFRADFGKAIQRSRRAADRLSKGVGFLMKKHKVPVFAGEGRLAGKGTVEVTGADGKTESLKAARILLATGSRPKLIPGVDVDGKRVLTSTEALILEEAPASLVIIGAGAVGVEFADIYAAYGTAVTLVEMLPTILPLEDAEISAVLHRVFEKRGIAIRTKTTVDEVAVGADGVEVGVVQEGKRERLQADAILVAIGRSPNSKVEGLDPLGVEVDRGFITVDDAMQTTAEGIYAIGDVTGQPLLAHAAMHEGIVAVERMAGLPARMDREKVPSCTYCHPQVASIGLTEAKAQAAGRKVKVGKFPFIASGKAQAMGETEGLVKLLADAETGEIVGVHIVGAGATELIAEAGLAMALEATPEEIAATIHSHPTLSEAVGEAALAALGRAIHI